MTACVSHLSELLSSTDTSGGTTYPQVRLILESGTKQSIGLAMMLAAETAVESKIKSIKGIKKKTVKAAMGRLSVSLMENDDQDADSDSHK